MEQYKDQLLQLFAEYTTLASESKSILADNTAFVQYAKNEFIVQEGKNNGNEYFLMEGIAHSFNISDEGEYITTGFYYAPSVIIPHFARTISSQSIFSLQALTDTVFAKIPVKVFDDLRYRYKDISEFGRVVVERELSRKISDETIFRSCTAKQRLIQMRDRYPNLENLVPHHIIASFLGITPVSFSRLRNEIASAG